MKNECQKDFHILLKMRLMFSDCMLVSISPMDVWHPYNRVLPALLKKKNLHTRLESIRIIYN